MVGYFFAAGVDRHSGWLSLQHQLSTCQCFTDLNGWTIDLKPLHTGEFTVDILSSSNIEYHYNPRRPVFCGKDHDGDAAVCRVDQTSGYRELMRSEEQSAVRFVARDSAHQIRLVYQPKTRSWGTQGEQTLSSSANRPSQLVP